MCFPLHSDPCLSVCPQTPARGGAPPPETGFISDLKAGDLLGRSNEELVLLLIQLRRQSTAIAAAQDRARQQLNAATSAPLPEGPQREAALLNIDRLRSQIRELDKQHELTRPLISLVDNMLKLSSLYEAPPPDGPSVQERRRFSQRVEERRMLREERRHWHAIAGQPFDMQDRLERRIELTRQEAGRAPLRDSERLLMQQRALQQELGQVRAALTSSARSLEDTAAENSRLEREMMMLRQRLQTVMTENSGPETLRSQEVRALEAELQRVQSLIDDLAVRREQLSRQVTALTQPPEPTARPRRHHQASWIETDLDSMVTVAGGRAAAFDKDQPLFVNTYYEHQPLVRGHEAPPPPAPSGHHTLPARPSRAAAERRRHASGPAPREPSPPGLGADDPAAGDKVSLDSGLNSSSPTDNSHQSLVQPDGPTSSDTLPGSWPSSQLESRALGGEPEYRGTQTQTGEYRGTQTHTGEYHGTRQQQPTAARNLAGVHQPGTTGSSAPPPPRHQYMNVAPAAAGGGQARVGGADGRESAPPESAVGEQSAQDQPRERDEPQELSEADERMQRFYGIIPKEKLEIKTVRIVKRESQLRQKDKSRRGMDESELTSVGEADNQEGDSESPENIIEQDAVLSQFRRALSLPRGYDRRSKASQDAISRIPNFRHQMLKRMVDRSPSTDRLSAHERLFGSNPSLPAGGGGTATSSGDSVQQGPASPVFKSDAARRIVEELQGPEQYRRARPRPKRRHFTISSSRPVHHEAAAPSPKLLSRSADDMDMERALGESGGTPDVVKSSLTRTDPRFDADTIDTLLGTPQKILIPERYVPELEVEPISVEERLQRSRKAASIRRMLTQSTGFLDSIGTADHQGPSPRGSVVTEKLQRAHILQLNEILARQVTEKSKRVAVEALATMERPRRAKEDDSPPPELPITQQRDSYLT
ncbi:hypothetical protein FJT64_002307 [Amphibalanus amphitrite]|uniref:Pleckstrin homology domain-containing protein n=1 Tax=Amphibalanus amphitrite TaxID=1232801 RepID=A0A6A4WZ94_AMPAM|nr:hypothetical protein FJT64_002307 [Amphibalanus amphitrite]